MAETVESGKDKRRRKAVFFSAETHARLFRLRNALGCESIKATVEKLVEIGERAARAGAKSVRKVS